MKRCRITIRQVVSRETFGLVPAGRNRKNNMNYVVTILTEKYLYRVNIEGGIKYTLGSGKKRFISDVRAWYRWTAWDVF